MIKTMTALKLLRDNTDTEAARSVLTSMIDEMDRLYSIAVRAVSIANALSNNEAYEVRWLQEILGFWRGLDGKDRGD